MSKMLIEILPRLMLFAFDDESQKTVSAPRPEPRSVERQETRVEVFVVSKRNDVDVLHQRSIHGLDHCKPEM